MQGSEPLLLSSPLPLHITIITIRMIIILTTLLLIIVIFFCKNSPFIILLWFLVAEVVHLGHPGRDCMLSLVREGKDS